MNLLRQWLAGTCSPIKPDVPKWVRFAIDLFDNPGVRYERELRCLGFMSVEGTEQDVQLSND